MLLKKEVKKKRKNKKMENENRKNIVWLSEITKQDVEIAGGKGANLAELYNAKLPVPEAFIVTANAYLNFIEEAGLKEKINEILHSIDVENTMELEEKAKEIQELIVNAEMPETLKEEILEAYECLSIEKVDAESIVKSEPCFVAVRSSATTEDLATASFAGQQETFLNVKGKEIIEAIKRCWSSLFTARAIYYRQRRGFSHEKALIAVIVQKMVNADKAGVTFTANPITNNKDEVVIEAVFGLGEGIVSGKLQPDTYVIDKSNFTIKSKKIGIKEFAFKISHEGKIEKEQLDEERKKQQVLSEKEIVELVKYGIRIENHYGLAQDIEWAIQNNKIYILQARPITTLKKEISGVKIEAKELLSGLAASPGIASGTVKIVHSLDDLAKIKENDVLVTKMTNPDMVVTMQKAKAIVTDEGGLTCHAAIVSREIGLPAVVGTKNATKVLKDNQVVTVDGYNGKVYEGIVKIEAKPEALVPESVKQAFTELKEKKVSKKRPLVKVNCDLPEVAERASLTNPDGIGLVRLEFIIAKGKVHPAEYIRRNQTKTYVSLLVDELEKILRFFKDKPVWIRTSDIRTDEYKNLEGAEKEPKESNPMLGWHGIRRSLDQPEILKAELTAIKSLYEKGYHNIGVMFPFLATVEELRKAKEIAKEISLPKEVKIGVMIETPASALIIEELCKEGIDFISFGTNDLTQLTLGVDRNNERLVRLYDEKHPAVIKLISDVIDVCKKYGVETSICGQAASDVEMVKILAKLGIDSVSANIDAVEKIRNALEEI